MGSNGSRQQEEMSKVNGSHAAQHSSANSSEATINALLKREGVQDLGDSGSAKLEPKVLRTSRDNFFQVETPDTRDAKKKLIQPVNHIIGPDGIPPEERLPSAREVQTQSHETASPFAPQHGYRVASSVPLNYGSNLSGVPEHKKVGQAPVSEEYPVDTVELSHKEAVKQPVIWNVTPSKDRIQEKGKEGPQLQVPTEPVQSLESSLKGSSIRKIYVSAGQSSGRVLLTPETNKNESPAFLSNRELRVNNPIGNAQAEPIVVTNSGPFESKPNQKEFKETVCGVKESSWGPSGATPEDLAYMEQQRKAQAAQEVAVTNQSAVNRSQQAPLPMPHVFPLQGDKSGEAQSKAH